MPNGSRVVSVGHYQPEKVLTNAELCEMVETTDEWITSRVGIKERRIAEKDEKVADLAFKAGQQALANSGLSASDIDMVLVGTTSAMDRTPNTACQVAARLGIETGSPAMDVNTACSGFGYAVGMADQFLKGGTAKRALVIGAEKLTQFTDWSDRSTCVLFGDGAGAVIMEATDETEQVTGPVVWGSVPAMADVIRITEDIPFIKQEGQSVYRWTVTSLPPLIRQTINDAGLEPASIKAFVLHQANLRIIEGISKRLGFDDAIIADDIIYSGNTSTASIPLALSKLVQEGKVQSGDPIVLFGFGGGLTYAGQVIYCP
ncbi:beta-ketoacyl-ACP synthase III [Natronoglycomyces albus]|uniref:Beta-ketoacyl-[acyl-carrier-protein] synthase III n=1 Tax=Natronoglycomyces albus TaxID=2811108 RepID=A0A895XKX5_9ACTN|nr:beta-ketoacyl-ACP synthase III [Natronoglycomyces albus]QSB04213.1 ketoacyl-ACP synthase III [Natronoglycomyces albus]